MRFHIEQLLPAPPEQVEDALVDPDFLAELGRLPKLGGAELLEQAVDGPVVVQRIRYAFTGQLSGAVRRVIDPVRLTWVEVATLDRRSHRTDWHIVPDHYGSLLRCWGTFQLEPEGASATRRLADGDVRVSVPLVGGTVEAALVSGLREHAELQEAALVEWLGRTAGDPPGH